jgi:hypothetical protein
VAKLLISLAISFVFCVVIGFAIFSQDFLTLLVVEESSSL